MIIQKTPLPADTGFAAPRNEAARTAEAARATHNHRTCSHSTTDAGHIPAELKALAQWLCWRLELRKGKLTKPPYDAKTGNYGKSNDPATWCTFKTALAAFQHGGYSGIGFAFHEGDGLTGLDLDHVIDLATGAVDPRALEILERFQATYCEVSPSGTGLRIFCQGQPGRSGKNEGRRKWLEVYDYTSPRYLTVTGQHWQGTAAAVTKQQDALDWFSATYFTKAVASKAHQQRSATDLGLDDTALIEKASNASNGVKFRALMAGDTSAYGDDHSAADLSLCSLLAFWTGNDAGRIDRIFRQSGLMREKWDRADYRQRTIDKAITECGEVYTGGSKARGNGPATEPPEREQPPPYGEPKAEGPPPRRQAAEGGDALTDLFYRKLSDITAKPIDWFWYPYIPRRANTLFTGDSDVGKSKAIASIISIATNGGKCPMSGAEIALGNVIILSAEEDAETMLKPTLLAAGADCNRVFLVDSCAEYDAQGRMRRRLVTMEKDVSQLKLLAGKIGNLSLAVIDPATAYLGTKISGNDNTAIRSVLSDLQTLAEEHGNANLLSTHFGKDNTRTAKLMVLGSIAFVAGVRSVIGIFRDPEDATGQRRLMIPVKCNLVPEADRVGVAFKIVGAEVFDGNTTPIATAKVHWFNERIYRKPDEILAATRAAAMTAEDGKLRMDPARQRIVDVIRAAGHPLGARQIAELLEGEAIPKPDDKRRVRVRRLLTKMLVDNQIERSQADDTYIIINNPSCYLHGFRRQN